MLELMNEKVIEVTNASWIYSRDPQYLNLFLQDFTHKSVLINTILSTTAGNDECNLNNLLNNKCNN